MFPEPRQGLVEGSDQALTRRRGVSRDGRGATPFVAQVQKMGPGPGEVAADGRDLGGMGIRRAVQPAPGNPVGDVDERDSYRRLPPPRAGRPCPLSQGSRSGRRPNQLLKQVPGSLGHGAWRVLRWTRHCMRETVPFSHGLRRRGRFWVATILWAWGLHRDWLERDPGHARRPGVPAFCNPLVTQKNQEPSRFQLSP